MLYTTEKVMSVQKFASQLKETIQGIKESGTEAILCENLIAYLEDVEGDSSHAPTEVELEKYKAELQLQIEQNKNIHNSKIEMFRSVISAGQNAIRTSFLMNGGASVALLAFIGHLAEIKPSSVVAFANVLLPFVLGVLAMTLTSGCTYISQWLYDSAKPKAQSWGFGLNILCIILGLLSYVFFVWGMYCAYSAFTTFV